MLIGSYGQCRWSGQCGAGRSISKIDGCVCVSVCFRAGVTGSLGSAPNGPIFLEFVGTHIPERKIDPPARTQEA